MESDPKLSTDLNSNVVVINDSISDVEQSRVRESGFRQFINLFTCFRMKR